MDEAQNIIYDESIIAIEESPDTQVNQEYTEFIDAIENDAIEVDVDDAFPAVGAPVAEKNHANLNGRDLPNQHPIGAIEGLRDELNEINSLKTVYSDKAQQANYYAWVDGNPHSDNRDGLFVSLLPSTDKIKVCDGTTDVFGVTVASAGFIGGEGYEIVGENKNKVSRGKDYSLVVCAGAVDVRCESDVHISFGDEPVYVVPNKDGVAQKANGNYGYLATNSKDIDGISYVTISLAAPSTKSKDIADKVQNLITRMSGAETNLGMTNTALQEAYYELQEFKYTYLQQKAEIDSGLEDTNDKININTDSLGDINAKADQIDAKATSALKVAADANIYVQETYSQVVDRANNAWDMAQSLLDELKEYENIAVRRDQYTIGEHSPMYGLTLTQAKNVLVENAIYIPTEDEVVEEYALDEPDENGNHVIQKSFYKNYYYTWMYPTNNDDGSNDYWFASALGSVTFMLNGGTEVPVGNQTILYLVVENENIVTTAGDIYEAGTLYEWQLPQNEGDIGRWVPMAKINQNALSRSVSTIYQTANEISQEVADARGDIAAISVKLDEDGAHASMITSVVTELAGVEPDQKVATKAELVAPGANNKYYCVGTKPPYDVYIWDSGANDFTLQTNLYYDGVKFCKINTASIINAVNNDGSSSVSINANVINFGGTSIFAQEDGTGGYTGINGDAIVTGTINVDRIDSDNLNIKAENIIFDGDVIFIQPSDLGENGTTEIDGARIKTGLIDAERINAQNLKVNAANIKGTLTIGQLPDTVAEQNDIPIKTSELENDSGDQDAIGVTTITRGVITTDYINALGITAEHIEVRDVGDFLLFKADTNNKEVQIGGFNISGNSLSVGDQDTYQDSILGTPNSVVISTGTTTTNVPSIGGSDENLTGWNFTAGNNFGVRTNTSGGSELYCQSENWEETSLSGDFIVKNDNLNFNQGYGGYYKNSTFYNYKASDWPTSSVTSAYLAAQFDNVTIDLSSFDGDTWNEILYIGVDQSKSYIQYTTATSNTSVKTTTCYCPNGIVTAYINESIKTQVTIDGLMYTQSTYTINKNATDGRSVRGISSVYLNLTVFGRLADGTITTQGMCLQMSNNPNFCFPNFSLNANKFSYKGDCLLKDFSISDDTNPFSRAYTVLAKGEISAPTFSNYSKITTSNLLIDSGILNGHGFGQIFLGDGLEFDGYFNVLNLGPNYIKSYKGNFMDSTGELVKTNFELTDSGLYASNIYTTNLHLYGNAYNSSGDTILSSDRNKKNTIAPLQEQYSQLFDAIKPVTFKYNKGTSDRTHVGLVAQDIKTAVESVGLTTQDFAGYCEWEDEEGNISCGLRYTEFISMCINEIQKLKARVSELENKD